MKNPVKKYMDQIQRPTTEPDKTKYRRKKKHKKIKDLGE